MLMDWKVKRNLVPVELFAQRALHLKVSSKLCFFNPLVRMVLTLIFKLKSEILRIKVVI